MVLNTVDVLVEALREAKLLRSEQFDQLVNQIAPAFSDTHELAKHVVKLGWITLYQAKKILSGHAQELVLGNYIIFDKIGEGGMGKVYKARQLRLSRTVALKVIRHDLLNNETALKRFHREAKAAAQLNHPNIVRLFDADQVGNRHFLAMEYVQGIDLAKLVKDAGPLPIGTACSFIRQSALGLQHAHEQGLVHRDTKPSNLLVASSSGKGSKESLVRDGIVKILDMGLARADGGLDADSDVTALTQTGTVIGTPDYMSPEQAKNSSAVDARSDLYSLGCTFYFLLTGQPPFPIGSTLEKLLQHQMDSPTHIQLLRPDIPSELASIIHALLAKRPEERFQSGIALATALEPWNEFDGDMQRLHARDDSPQSFPQAIPVMSPTTEYLPPASTQPHAATQPDPFDFDRMATPAPMPAPQPTVNQNDAPPEEPGRKRPVALWLGGVVAGLGLLIAGFLIAQAMNKKEESKPPPEPEPTLAKEEPPPKKETSKKETPKKEQPPPKKSEIEPLDAILPYDTGAVFVLSPSRLASANFFKKNVQPHLEPLLAFIRLTARIDPLQAVERATLAVPTDGRDGTLILQGHGGFANQLQKWAMGDLKGKKIDEPSDDGFRYTVVEFQLDSNKPPAFLAVLTPRLVAISSSRTGLHGAMSRADEITKSANRPKKPFKDATLSAALTRHDRSAVLWGCIGGAALKTAGKSVPGPAGKGTPTGELGISSLVASVRLADDLEFDAFLEADSPDSAARVTVFLQSELLKNLKKKDDSLSIAFGELIEKAKWEPALKSGNKVVLHLHRHLAGEELTHWFGRLLSELSKKGDTTPQP